VLLSRILFVQYMVSYEQVMDHFRVSNGYGVALFLSIKLILKWTFIISNNEEKTQTTNACLVFSNQIIMSFMNHFDHDIKGNFFTLTIFNSKWKFQMHHLIWDTSEIDKQKFLLLFKPNEN